MQGQTNNTMYIIKTGRVDVLIRNADEEKVVATLGAGTFFGERALLRNEPASATIRSATELACYCCDRATFQTFFGSLQVDRYRSRDVAEVASSLYICSFMNSS